MYNLDSFDPYHKEALDRATTLLQTFMERQEKLRQMINGKIPFDDFVLDYAATSERNNNALIITCIQWIRYFLWGNSPEVVRIKTKSLNRWCWNNTISGPKIFPWAEKFLKIDNSELDPYGHMTYRKMIEHLLNIVIPKRTGGLFGMLDGDYGSITLEECVGKMRKEME